MKAEKIDLAAALAEATTRSAEVLAEVTTVATALQVRLKIRGEGDFVAVAEACSLPIPIGASHDTIIQPDRRESVSTDVSMEIPAGYEAQIRPNPALAMKTGITMLCAPQSVVHGDSADIVVHLINHSPYPYRIHAGDEIATMVFVKVESVVIV